MSSDEPTTAAPQHILMRIVESSVWSGEYPATSSDFEYDVFIYSATEIPPELRTDSPGLSSATSDHHNDWPLRGRQTIRISDDPERKGNTSTTPLAGHLSSREYYMMWFRNKETSALRSEQLLKCLSEGLRRFLSRSHRERLIVWWDCLSPALAELPWELPFYYASGNSIAFFRGTPPEKSKQALEYYRFPRLAVVGQPPDSPWKEGAWRSLLEDQFPDTYLEIDQFEGDPIVALRKVVQEGYEFVHLFARGDITEAYESTIYLNDGMTDQYNRPFTPAELSLILRSGRVAALSISPSNDSQPAPEAFTEQGLPEIVPTYWSFAALGRSGYPLPPLVVPLGFLSRRESNAFYVNYYRKLSKTGDLAEAVLAGQRAVNGLAPVSAFPRGFSNLVARPYTLPELLDNQSLMRDIPEETLSQILAALDTDNNELIESRSHMNQIRASLRQVQIERLTTEIVRNLLEIVKESSLPKDKLPSIEVTLPQTVNRELIE